MKNLFFIFLNLSLVTFSLSPTWGQSSISFATGTWEEIREKAKTENKIIFLDAYTTWCVPCKKMEKEVFTDDSVASYFNAHFINYRLDMETDEGERFNELIPVGAYPSLFLFYPDGVIARKQIGSMKAPAFLEWAYQVGDSSRSEIYRVSRQFKDGTLAGDSVRSFIKARTKAGYPMDSLGYAYLHSIQPEDLENKENLWVYMMFDQDIQSDYSKYYIEHAESFIKKDTSGTFPIKIAQLVNKYIQTPEGKADLAVVKAYLKTYITQKSTWKKIVDRAKDLK